MLNLGLHLNDAELTLVSQGNIVYREPGYAMIDNEEFSFGNKAYKHARTNPRQIHNRFWSDLLLTPSSNKNFHNLSRADIASYHLEDILQSNITSDESMVVVVPPYFDSSALSLFLGIAADLKLPISVLVDSAVAATRCEYKNAVPIHVDISLHYTTLSRLTQQQGIYIDKVEIIENCGISEMCNAWLNVIAKSFVEQSRFDPMHKAETEQVLLNQLEGCLDSVLKQENIKLSLEYLGVKHSAEIDSKTFKSAASSFFHLISDKLRYLYNADEIPAIQVTDRVAKLPGLLETLQDSSRGEIFTLEPGATIQGGLSRLKNNADTKSEISLLKQLPWDKPSISVESNEVKNFVVNSPTHIIFRNKAYKLHESPLVIGYQVDDEPYFLATEYNLSGVSRRHCIVTRIEGRTVIEDVSQYGTFLNGNRINGSSVLKVGDSVRIGTPGVHLELITLDMDNGT